jgi:Animal haem peroxidase
LLRDFETGARLVVPRPGDLWVLVDSGGLFTLFTLSEAFLAGADGARTSENIDQSELDSIIGGLLEEKYYDSQLGETFTKLTVMQFEALRDGDKLYYENHFKSNPLVLAEIEHTSLADIIARNSGIDHIYHDAFAALPG